MYQNNVYYLWSLCTTLRWAPCPLLNLSFVSRISVRVTFQSGTHLAVAVSVVQVCKCCVRNDHYCNKEAVASLLWHPIIAYASFDKFG